MKRKITFFGLILVLLSCSHHMIKDYIMATDDNKREIFRIFHVDTTAIFEYCHNNFLPVRYQPPFFGKKVWIDIMEDKDLRVVILFLKQSAFSIEPILEIVAGSDTVYLSPSKDAEIKKRKGGRAIKRAYRIHSYSGTELEKILNIISTDFNKVSGIRTYGLMPMNTSNHRKISGTDIRREQTKSRFYEFDENEKLGIKNSLELYRDLKRKYKQ